MFFILFSVFLLAVRCIGQSTAPDLNNITTAFSTAQIVPDVLPSFAPADGVNLTFTDPISTQSVDVVPGILLTMEQTSMHPDLTLVIPSMTTSNNSTTFVVVLLDPDAPTPQNPNVSQFLHFLGGDFTADSTSGLLSNSTPALMEFFPPTPPTGSDPHRYVLLVFDQPDNFDLNGPTLVNASTPRTNFSITDFAQAVNLGDTIAGNYFLVGPMDSSPNTSSGTFTNQPSTSFTLPIIPSGSGIMVTDTLASTTPTGAAATPTSSTSNAGIIQSTVLRFLSAAFVVMTACLL